MVIKYCYSVLSFFFVVLITCSPDENEHRIPKVASLHDHHSFTESDQTQSLGIEETLVVQLKQIARNAIQQAQPVEPKGRYLYCDKTGTLILVFWEKRFFEFLAIPRNVQNLNLSMESTESIKAKGVDIDRWLEINKLRRELRGYPGSAGPEVAIILD